VTEERDRNVCDKRWILSCTVTWSLWNYLAYTRKFSAALIWQKNSPRYSVFVAVPSTGNTSVTRRVGTILLIVVY
jgi:hypothetical protein